jgi:UDP-N-acetylmuramoyl-L-alanyl-D-glutamate--2,6-diaminopimelate ligase
MLLRDLAAMLDARLIGDGDVDVTSIQYDSRAAGPGSLFVAVPGFTVDGHAYLGRAVASGTQAVAVQADREGIWHALVEGGGADLLVLPDTRRGMADISAAFHGYPARKLGVIGVTGTDGKTSLCHLIGHVLDQAGLKSGLITTAECRIGDEYLPDTGRFTTPEAPQVQAMLARMVEVGCKWAVIEATSHGLALHRVDACEYDIAAFTNLGTDHIDFHGGQEAYREAKGRLFALLDSAVEKGIQKSAVVNRDDPACGYFQEQSSARAIEYGLGPMSHVWARDIRPEAWQTRVEIVVQAMGGGLSSADVCVPKPGSMNVYNALAATGVGLAAGLDLDQVIRGIESWPGAPGRIERIDEGQPFTVLVDFAHAPDSLRRVLEMLRETNSGRIIAVFGAIGERDKARRPGMARAAAELADYTFVTDDNPYTEDRQAILDDIASALRDAGKREGHDFAVVPDRREAVAQALSMAVDEDVVLLAGKGHEREVHIGEGGYDCDDREVSRRVLREMGYRRGESQAIGQS